MKQIFWILLGVIFGFVAAHQINQTEKGREFFNTMNDRISDFNDALVEGYKAREAELRAQR